MSHRVFAITLLAICLLPIGCVAPTAAPPPANQQMSEWDQVLAAAKREGKVVVIGGAGSGTADALTMDFQRLYPDIQLDFSGMAGSQVPPKITAEAATGKMITDLTIVGTTTTIEVFMPSNLVDPIRTYLVGPNTTPEESQWRGGKFTFADDEGKYAFVSILYVKAPLVYNPDAVSPNDIRSYRDLLDPKWKGKIAMFDPRRPGGGLANSTFWYANPQLGPEYIRQLFSTQDITISSDSNQLIDWVAKGQYAMALGVGDLESIEAIRKGLPIKQMPGDVFREGTYVTPGNGSLAVMKDPPHPNALKVYLNWLLSKDGQYAWSKGAGFASVRADVPTDHVPDYLVPKANVAYDDNYAERYVKLREDIVQYLGPLLPR